jgi:hypothetical protein
MALTRGEADNTPVKRALISAASSGDNTLVAGVTGKKIRVLQFALVSVTAVAVRFESAASGTAIPGVMSLGATGVLSAGYCPVGHFETIAGELLNLELGGAVQVSGWLVYQEV